MSRAATLEINAWVLPTEIRKVLKGNRINITPATTNEKWYYAVSNVPHNAGSTNLIKGYYLQTPNGTTMGSTPATVSTSDKIRFIFIKHTGTSDGTTSTTESLTICFDGATVAYNTGDAIEIGPGECWFGKLPNCTVDNLHAISVDSNMNDAGSAGEGAVQALVFAILDDV